jgi:hypothetical protein
MKTQFNPGSWRGLIAPLAVVALVAACSEGPTAVAPDDATIGVSSPNTPAGVTFVISGGTSLRESGPGINDEGKEQGTCEEGGRWRNGAGNLAGATPHENCIIAGGASVTVNFPLSANFVLPPSGNKNLNFSMCGYAEDDEGEWVPVACEGQTFVHYTRKQNVMTGSGTIGGEGSDGSRWTISLAQISAQVGDKFMGTPNNEINYNFAAVQVGGDGYGLARLKW